MHDIVRFAIATTPSYNYGKPYSDVVGESTYAVLTMVSKTWCFARMDGRLQAERGWYCDRCHTTFFVSEPMTQLSHGCMKEAPHSNSRISM